ncbi:MAG: choice-of-anchor V domain-containing protein [Bradymonadia bacterium]
MPSTLRTLALAGLAGTLLPLTAQANSAGRPGADVAEMGCATGLGCHDGEGTSPLVELALTADPIAPGETIDITVTVEGDGAVAGITAAASDGTLAGDGETTRDLLGTVTQNAMAQEFAGGQATFTMRWTAPDAEGTYTLFVAGNNANGDRTITGDNWTTTTAELVVGGAGEGGAGGGGEAGAGGGEGGAGGEPVGGGATGADGGVDGGGSDDDDSGCQTAAGRTGAGGLLLLVGLGGLLLRRRRA